jgi:hypothetical protein
MEQYTPSPHPSLEEVQRQFDSWRKSGKHRTLIPPRVWNAAVSLAGRYSTHKISTTLRLNYTQLRKRISLAGAAEKTVASPPSMPFADFVEYSVCPPHKPQCLIEMENRHGDKMRIFVSVESSPDLLRLGKSFWSRKP